MVSFILSGKILEKSTKKPLSNKKYPELTIFVSGSNVTAKAVSYTHLDVYKRQVEHLFG